MLQIKNTLGGGKPEGLYAWKKSSIDFIYKEASAEKYGNVYMDTTPQSGSVKVYTGSTYTFDKSTGMYTITDPFEHSVALNGSTTSFTNVYLTYGSPTSAKMWTSVKNQEFKVYNNSSGVYLSNNISDYAIYAYSNKSEPTYTFLDYIVSDKETAYPDGGEKDGYWYERVVEGAKVATGEITFSSSVNNITIEHGLGKEPKSIFLINILKSTSTMQTAVASAYKNGTDSKIIATKAYSDGTNGFSPGKVTSGHGDTYDNAVITADINNIYVPISYLYTAENRYLGTYKWFALV